MCEHETVFNAADVMRGEGNEQGDVYFKVSVYVWRVDLPLRSAYIMQSERWISEDKYEETELAYDIFMRRRVLLPEIVERDWQAQRFALATLDDLISEGKEKIAECSDIFKLINDNLY